MTVSVAVLRSLRMAAGDPTTTDTPIFDWKVDTPVPTAIFEALGAASMCWETPEGAGVFDSSRAAAIGDELIVFLRRKLWIEE